jgi:hypothetical protein
VNGKKRELNQMELVITEKPGMPISTNTDPIKCKLLIEVNGTTMECEFFKKTILNLLDEMARCSS